MISTVVMNGTYWSNPSNAKLKGMVERRCDSDEKRWGMLTIIGQPEHLYLWTEIPESSFVSSKRAKLLLQNLSESHLSKAARFDRSRQACLERFLLFGLQIVHSTSTIPKWFSLCLLNVCSCPWVLKNLPSWCGSRRFRFQDPSDVDICTEYISESCNIQRLFRRADPMSGMLALEDC